jgi:hypothetical protein
VRTARLLAATLAAGIVAALAGCGSPAQPPPRLPSVSVLLIQYRSDIAPHRLQLEVVNGSSSAIVVRRARLLTSGYRTAPVWKDPVAAEIPAGATVDLPAQLGTAACGRAGTPRAELTVERKGTTTSVTVPTTDSHGTLAALHRGDCFAERAARIATLAFAALTPGGGGIASLTLEVRPGPDAAQGLGVVRVLPTTLLSPTRQRNDWAVGRRIGVDHGPIVLPAIPTRCDLHAIAEDKLGSVLPVSVRLPDGSSGLVQVVAPPAVKNEVLRWVSDTCATGR